MKGTVMKRVAMLPFLTMLSLALISAMTWQAQAARAENASVLLQRYGIQVYDPVAEGEKLAELQEAYTAAIRKVNDQTMLSSAYDVAELQAARSLTARDQAILELEDQLLMLERQMSESFEADVATIMALDARYRSLADELKQQRASRAAWLGQLKAADMPVFADREQNIVKLTKIKRDVDKQKRLLERAQSYAELGEVSAFRSPLSIPAAVSSPFGERLDPITQDAVTFHAGIDFAVPTGTQVLAAFHGVVHEASQSEELGRYVILDHGSGIRTLYGHLEDIQVKVRQRVQQYDPIATSGNTGSRTTGPHLHFGLYIGGSAVNPALILSQPGG